MIETILHVLATWTGMAIAVLLWKIKWIPQRESFYQEISEHPLDCPWHKDWHACNCGLFDNKENEE